MKNTEKIDVVFQGYQSKAPEVKGYECFFVARTGRTKTVFTYRRKPIKSQAQVCSDMEMDRQAARDGYNPNW